MHQLRPLPLPNIWQLTALMAIPRDSRTPQFRMTFRTFRCALFGGAYPGRLGAPASRGASSLQLALQLPWQAPYMLVRHRRRLCPVGSPALIIQGLVGCCCHRAIPWLQRLRASWCAAQIYPAANFQRADVLMCVCMS